MDKNETLYCWVKKGDAFLHSLFFMFFCIYLYLSLYMPS